MREVARQCWIDPHRRELQASVDGLLKLAADLVLLDPQIADFLFAQQLQELTVRNALHHTPFDKQKLNEGQHDKRDGEVRQVPLVGFFHGRGSEKGPRRGWRNRESGQCFLRLSDKKSLS